MPHLLWTTFQFSNRPHCPVISRANNRGQSIRHNWDRIMRTALHSWSKSPNDSRCRLLLRSYSSGTLRTSLGHVRHFIFFSHSALHFSTWNFIDRVLGQRTNFIVALGFSPASGPPMFKDFAAQPEINWNYTLQL